MTMLVTASYCLYFEIIIFHATLRVCRSRAGRGGAVRCARALRCIMRALTRGALRYGHQGAWDPRTTRESAIFTLCT